MFFFRLVYHILPVSLDCTFCIAPSVFSNLTFIYYIVCSDCISGITFIGYAHNKEIGKKSFGVEVNQGLNKIAKFEYGHLCLREDNHSNKT